jgi:type II secretory pathway pseudopilin PulG
MRSGDARPVHGFTYLALLIAVALIGLGLAAASEVWSKTVERQRLQELGWIGQQYVQAIGSYYEATPGLVVKTFPKSLEDLLEDKRYVVKRRHIRRLYPNPMTNQTDWIVIAAPQGGVRGVKALIRENASDTRTAEEKVFVYVPPGSVR